MISFLLQEENNDVCGGRITAAAQHIKRFHVKMCIVFSGIASGRFSR